MKKSIRIVLLVVFVAVFVYSAGSLIWYGIMTARESDLEDELQQFNPGFEISSADSTTSATTSDQSPETPGDNSTTESSSAPNNYTGLAELKKQNDDVRGWITLPDTRVNYPMVQAADNDYYLTHNVKKGQNTIGSIFLDFRNAPDFSDDITIIYGHQVDNGKMFEDVRKYRDEAFFNSHLTANLWSMDTAYEIEFFAFMMITGEDDIYQTVNFDSTEAYNNMVQDVFSRATYTADVDVQEGDRLVMLSTCTYEFEDARAVLFGRLVEK